LYATGSVDKSVSRLVFSGVLKTDSNNQLQADLAKDWQVDASGLNYTIHLRPGLTWQDGQPLTADDVVYTYQTIQNPDAQSPLLPGWQNVAVKELDKQTVVLTLPNPLTSFAYSLTTGIIPKHILQDVAPDQLRSVSFNTAHPVGAGPFRWEAIQVDGQTPETRQEQIALTPFEGYAQGRPKLNKFIIRAYHDEKSMAAAFERQELNGVAGLSSMPAELKGKSSVNQYDIPLLGEVDVFLKNSNPVLSNIKVRQALELATDRVDIIKGLGYPVVPADEPILKTDLGYNNKYAESAFNLAAAKKLLADDGWQLNSQGFLSKKDQELTFTLFTQGSTDYKYIIKKLTNQWGQLGVKLTVNVQTDTQLQQSLSNHSYDALLYGIEMGPDPDVFAYWDSAQADIRAQNRTNFSEYKSSTADAALEAGRTRLLPKLRIIKYQPFLQAWRDDVPAIALYQPRFLYVTRGQVFGFGPTSLSSGSDRYANVSNWMIREDKLPTNN
ncbi:MAG: ABC transporter substrate-binding protein, partial [Candidatus Saccharimonadales bacterium]